MGVVALVVAVLVVIDDSIDGGVGGDIGDGIGSGIGGVGDGIGGCISGGVGGGIGGQQRVGIHTQKINGLATGLQRVGNGLCYKKTRKNDGSVTGQATGRQQVIGPQKKQGRNDG